MCLYPRHRLWQDDRQSRRDNQRVPPSYLPLPILRLCLPLFVLLSPHDALACNNQLGPTAGYPAV